MDSLKFSGPGLGMLDARYVNVTGDTMTGALILANIASSLTVPELTLGSIPFAGVGGLITQDNANLSWDNTNKRLGIGVAPNILHAVGIGGTVSGTNPSLLNINGSIAGPGASGLRFTLGMATSSAIQTQSAFLMTANVNTGGILPQISGIIAKVVNNSTQTWGASPGSTSPAVFRGSFGSNTGASQLGNHISVFQSAKPTFTGTATPRTADGVYIGFEAQTADGTVVDSTWGNSYGLYSFAQLGTVEGAGIFVGGGNSHYGIVLNGNASTSGIVFGTARSAIMFYDGTNFVINPKLAGAGALSILGNISLLDLNMVLGTTTGTIFGTATTQKLSFWNATPIVQPANTVAIDDVLINTGLWASGGASAVFTKPIKITPPPQAISTGSAPIAGNATLVGGTVTINTTAVKTASIVMLTRKTSGGTIGTAITYTIINATSFTINSDNILDTSTFSWFIIDTY